METYNAKVVSTSKMEMESEHNNNEGSDKNIFSGLRNENLLKLYKVILW